MLNGNVNPHIMIIFLDAMAGLFGFYRYLREIAEQRYSVSNFEKVWLIET